MKYILPMLLLLAGCTISPLKYEQPPQPSCPDVYVEQPVINVEIPSVTDFCPAVQAPKTVYRTKKCSMPALIALTKKPRIDVTHYATNPDALIERLLKDVASYEKMVSKAYVEYMECQ